MTGSEDALLEEQLRYYRARALEYDQWWLREGRYDRGRVANERWFSESQDVTLALTKFQPSGRVLELACGTGIWSEKLLPFASSLTVVDGADEMLELARRRLRSPKVRYVRANLFEWHPNESFDMVFFSFWLSHVPPERFVDFWRVVGNCLAPGGRVFFVDSRHEESSTATDHRLPSVEATTLQRRLNDGREFQIYKVYYDVSGLGERLDELGWDVDVFSTERYFIYGQGHRKAAFDEAMQRDVTNSKTKVEPTIKGIAPQLLVDDLDRSIACYRDELGFDVDFVYESFYASVSRNGASIQLKCAPKTTADREHRRANEHLDAYVDVSNIDALFAELSARGANVTKGLEDQPWHCRDFYVEDIDGHILCFSEAVA